jgi:crotonobetainyl-CoA:carnitine CoA-transferase CaiB-like acyl-CoA transferase
MMNALSAGIPQRVDEDGLCRRDAGVLTNFRSTRLAAGWIGACYSTNWDRITDMVGMPSVAEQAMYQYYETRDGQFVLFCAIEPKFWTNFRRATGREDLRPFDGPAGPVDFAAEEDLRRDLAELFRTRTQAQWVRMAAEHDIALGPSYNDVAEMAADAHVIERGILHDAIHPDAGELTYVGQPALVDGNRFGIHRHAPALGEHTHEVLGSLGYDESALRKLAEQRVIRARLMED